MFAAMCGTLIPEMSPLSVFFFLLFVLVAVPIFFAFPFHAYLLARRWKREEQPNPLDPLEEPPGGWPNLTCILPCANEEATIASRIENLLNAYPLDKMRLLVVINNCTDRTREICSQLPVEVIESESGKVYALEAGRRAADTELVLATDCDVQHDADAIKHLVTALLRSDMDVCAISALCSFTPSRDTRLTRQMSAYERRYSRLCYMHGQIHSTVMLQGPLTLYRRNALPPLPLDACEDELALGIAVIRSGKRIIIHPAVWADQPVPGQTWSVLKMRTRHAGRQVHTCLHNWTFSFSPGTGFAGHIIFPFYVSLPRLLPCVTLLLALAPWCMGFSPIPLYTGATTLLVLLCLLRPFAALQLLALHLGWIYMLFLPHNKSTWRNTKRT